MKLTLLSYANIFNWNSYLAINDAAGAQFYYVDLDLTVGDGQGGLADQINASFDKTVYC